jgi:hypothetical protein
LDNHVVNPVNPGIACARPDDGRIVLGTSAGESDPRFLSSGDAYWLQSCPRGPTRHLLSTNRQKT